MEQMARVRDWGGRSWWRSPRSGSSMIFRETPLAGAWRPGARALRGRPGLLRPHLVPRRVRGARARPASGAVQRLLQPRRGTLRGLHFQAAPHEEVKLVRCTRGAHLRRDRRPPAGLADPRAALRGRPHGGGGQRSSTSPRGGARLPDPGGRDRGLLPDFRASTRPSTPAGFRWDDPAFGIPWPEPVDRDLRARTATCRSSGHEAMTAAKTMHPLRSPDLYPICRSITGDGVRQTLATVARAHPAARSTRCRRGTPVFDWTVPREWNIRDAWIKDPSGRKVVDFQV